MQNHQSNNKKNPGYVDPWAETQVNPVDPSGPTQPNPAVTPPGTIPSPYGNEPVPTNPAPPTYQTIEQARLNPSVRPTPRKRWSCCSCGTLLLPVFVLLLVIALGYFLIPLRTNVLILGIDARPEEGVLGRSDTIIMGTVIPLKPYIGMLSIPRDLWVSVPGHGENRINTAHFFAEAEQAGSGPYAAMDAIRQNFGVDVSYFVRIKFSGFKDIVDAMGGINVDLPTAMSGYEAGQHHLDGTQALALVRDRSGSDDFFRMGRGQIFLKSAFQEMINPAFWPRLPQVYQAISQSVDTNIPIWQWPRLGLALLRSGPGGIDSRVISREMVNPFTTSGGANVLGPNWEAINPVLLEMFGQ